MPTSFSNTKKYEVVARNENNNWEFREQHHTFIGMLFCLLDTMKYDDVSIFIRKRRNNMRKESWFIRLLKKIGLIKTYEVSKKEMCERAKSICSRECESCAWYEEDKELEELTSKAFLSMAYELED